MVCNDSAALPGPNGLKGAEAPADTASGRSRRLADAPDGRMRRIDLAHAAGVTPSGITRLLDGLEASGLVGRHYCTEDHRVTYAVITDTGRHVLRTTAETHLAGLVALFAERFTPQEVDQLVSLLGRLPGADDSVGCPAAAAQAEA